MNLIKKNLDKDSGKVVTVYLLEKLTLIIITIVLSFNIIYSDPAYGAKLVALSDQIITQQGTEIPITLKVNGTETLNNKLTFSFSLPKNGTLLGTAPNLLYRPNGIFHGRDSFTFIAHDATTDSNNATITIIVNPSSVQPFISDPQQRIGISFVISFLVVIFIIIAAWRILRRRKFQQYSKFSDIIRTDDWDPSLSIFQFLLWTIVLIFAFLAVYLIRIFGGISAPPQGGIPVNLLALTGISVGVPIASNVISSYKYSPAKLSKERPPPDQMPGYSDMLKEYGKPTLSRFQMFGWTWIGIGIYLFVFFSKITEMSIQVQNLTLPDIDPTLVVLMGLSQTAFLGGKTVASKMEITNIVPAEGETGKPIQIFGSNFGNNPDTVWFGDLQIRGNDVTWMDDRIDIKVPVAITEAKKYAIKVAKGGFLTDEKVFTVTKVIIATAPTVISTIPNSGSSGVAVNTSVTATFSQPIDASTVNANTFTLKDNSSNNNVLGTISISSDDKTVSFKPSANLQSSTLHTATISTGIRDLEGKAMSTTKSWSFTTTE